MAKKQKTRDLCASDLLKEGHPVHQAFARWSANRGAEKLTRRQARKFLQVYPNYRSIQEAA